MSTIRVVVAVAISVLEALPVLFCMPRIESVIPIKVPVVEPVVAPSIAMHIIVPPTHTLAVTCVIAGPVCQFLGIPSIIPIWAAIIIGSPSSLGQSGRREYQEYEKRKHTPPCRWLHKNLQSWLSF
jgi:hypothetical protein